MTTVLLSTRSRLIREPQTWVYAVAVVAAVTVVGLHLIAAAPASPHQHAHHEHSLLPAESLQQSQSAVWTSWMWWVLMAAAMMLPIAARGAGRVARASLWPRRHVAMVEYLVGYLAVWALIGLGAIWLVTGLYPAGAPVITAAVALVAAAAWHVTPWRRRMLRRCGSAGFVNVYGWRADWDCAAAGAAFGRRCVITCGPAMVVMAVSHSVLLMAGLAVVLWSERIRGPNPSQRAGHPQQAWGLLTLAVVVAAWGPLLP